MLATAYHETAATMLPIEEYGKGSKLDYGRWRVINGKSMCFKDGSRKSYYSKDQYPHLYYGRGYVQLTWYSNYEKAGNKVCVNLLSNPSLACNPHIAAQVMYHGMIEGWFTGRSLSRYMNIFYADYTEARRIINGTDKQHHIARIATEFELALRRSI